MPIKLNGTTNGSIELNVPDAVGSDLQITLPATAGEIVVKDSSGKVGIGTTNLSTTFTAYGGNTGLELDTSIGFSSRANTGTLRAYDRAGSAYRDLGITGANILFGITDHEKARIDSSGNVLIGTTTLPTSDSRLTVQNQSSHCELNIISSPSHGSLINMGDTGDYNIGRIKYDNSSNSMQFQTDNIERMRITSTAVTKPKQPGFYARRTTSGDNRPTGHITEWTISGIGSYNEGNHFHTVGSNAGLFVAPVDGVYYFAAQPGYKQSSHNLSWYWEINGTAVAEPIRVIDSGDDLQSHSAFTGTFVIHLTAGEKVGLAIQQPHHANVVYNFFCGYLIG